MADIASSFNLPRVSPEREGTPANKAMVRIVNDNFRELRDRTGLSSPSVVQYHLDWLRANGYVEGAGRALKVTKAGREVAA